MKLAFHNSRSQQPRDPDLADVAKEESAMEVPCRIMILHPTTMKWHLRTPVKPRMISALLPPVAVAPATVIATVIVTAIVLHIINTTPNPPAADRIAVITKIVVQEEGEIKDGTETEETETRGTNEIETAEEAITIAITEATGMTEDGREMILIIEEAADRAEVETHQDILLD